MESHLRKEVGQTVIDFQGALARRRQASGNGVSMTDDTRDRVIRLETEIDHMASQVKDMQTKVNAMHELLMQAKGMKYLIVIMAAVAGFFASFAAKYIPFMRG